MEAKGFSLSFALVLLAVPQFVFSADTTELKYGFYADKKVLSNRMVVLNDALSKRINEIGNRVVRVSDRPDMKYTFRVLNDPTINAFAAASGMVYINTGLLDVLESEDELAAILAHEIGHVADGHQIKSIRSAHEKAARGKMVGYAIGVGLATLGEAAIGSPPAGQPGSSAYHRDIVASHMTEMSFDVGLSVGGELAVYMIKGYKKEQELKADALAVQYAHKAGYNPRAIIDVFKRFISIRDRLKLNEENYVSSLINAKPGLEARIEAATKLVTKGK